MMTTSSPAEQAQTAKDGKGILITAPAMQQLARLCGDQGDEQVLRVGVRSATKVDLKVRRRPFPEVSDFCPI